MSGALSKKPRLHPAVLDARERVAAGRERLRQQHERGSPGIQVCAGMTDVVDAIVLDLYALALSEIDDPGLESEIALVPNGGYGRRDMAPYSDVDLMLLHERGQDARVEPLAARLVQHLGDASLSLGFSVRSIRECCALAPKDAMVFTTLAESRYLGGSVSLYSRFMDRFRVVARRRSRSIIDKIEKARRDEKHHYGETVYLLRPNIKKSRGSLRDLQMVRWVGFARYGEAEPDNLVRLGVLSKTDYRDLRKAREFLLRLRNEMHFHAGKAQDILLRDEQLRLARLHNFSESDGQHPTEEFMRLYFAHTSSVRYAVAHFIATAKSRNTFASLVARLFTRREGDYLIGPSEIAATAEGLAKLKGNLAEVLHLMDLANRAQARIAHPTWEAIRSDMLSRDSIELTSEAAERFLSLVSRPGRLGDLLRRLHEMRVLEKIIPAVKHARCLMQFNEYHKYTVDEHSIRAVQQAADFMLDARTVGDVYRAIKDKRILHLALLLHDLGKGLPNDHSEEGRIIAKQSCQRLGLSTEESDVVEFLVHKHLLMAHLALRKDLNDQRVIVEFAREVGSISVLQMLYVLTCADIAAVGPGTLNNWKLGFITALYQRTYDYLESANVPQGTDWLEDLREQVRDLVGTQEDQGWWDRQINDLPVGYLTGEPPERIAADLQQLHDLPNGSVFTSAQFVADRDVVEYTVGTHDGITPGVFHQLTGVLSSRGMQIVSAEIHSLAFGLLLDRFWVVDQEFSGEPPESRLEEVRQSLAKSLTSPGEGQPTFRRLWTPSGHAADSIPDDMPTRVTVDNKSSDRFSIITVFAYDRLGLLYSITRTLFELGLHVHLARVGTYLDQVVDVFYVADLEGRKIDDPTRRDEIKEALLEAVGEQPIL